MNRSPTLAIPLSWDAVINLRRWVEAVTAMFDRPHVLARITAESTGATTKTLTVRVVNRAGQRAGGRFLLRLVSLNGTALDTSTTFVVSTGLLVQAVATGVRDVMTDATGEAVLTLTYAGTGGQTRALVVDCGGDSEETTLQW